MPFSLSNPNEVKDLLYGQTAAAEVVPAARGPCRQAIFALDALGICDGLTTNPYIQCVQHRTSVGARLIIGLCSDMAGEHIRTQVSNGTP